MRHVTITAQFVRSATCPVCTGNLVRIDPATESRNVAGR